MARARQALAIDEHRFDFRPELWTAALAGQTVEQRWFAGVHSNVGGGYVHDGLANITFRWILEAAAAEGLDTDPSYIKFFKPFFGHSLYESSTPFYKVLDGVRSAMGRGKRVIHGYNADVVPSVIQRMTASLDDVLDAEDQPVKTPYRPANVMRFLAEQPDLQAYLQQIGGFRKEIAATAASAAAAAPAR